ncbi:YueI family protein [Bombilactobacillus thymidiniphilus]|uniref:YueI family protein n=1 Tax=Bombilactobacillus thymidiniphilus TaxID=2923363 RepID=A0ABY4PBL7_9LACO|nr:YueI family protein [Bombilactobacillus thymidiniphilus]UQS83039.1 YueI family protein [Bombilactobacillus thymidiniphilus]
MMTSVEDYLKQNVFGKPQLKPDERKKFLGNFQERVALALTVAQTNNLANLPMVEKVMQRNPQYHLYLNGRLNDKARQAVIKLAVQNNFAFTIMEQANMRTATKDLSDQDMGLVIADDHQAIKKPVLL